MTRDPLRDRIRRGIDDTGTFAEAVIALGVTALLLLLCARFVAMHGWLGNRALVGAGLGLAAASVICASLFARWLGGRAGRRAR